MLKIVFKKSVYPSVLLNQPRITIGREPENSIVLSGKGISGFHAELRNREGQFFVVDLGSTNGTFLNGQRITGKEQLKAWDTICFDDIEAEIHSSENMQGTLEKRSLQMEDWDQHWQLIGESEPVHKKRFPIWGKTTVGRDSSNHVHINLDTVSGCHAKLEVIDDALHVFDLNSTNGTFLNGEKISMAVAQSGDEITFDQVKMKVQGPVAYKTTIRPVLSENQHSRPLDEDAPKDEAGDVHEEDLMIVRQAGEELPPKVSAKQWVVGTMRRMNRLPLRTAALWMGLALMVYWIARSNSLHSILHDTYRLMVGEAISEPQQSETLNPFAVGKIWEQQLIPGGSHLNTPVLADINGDQILDVIVSDQMGYVLAMDGRQGHKMFLTEVYDWVEAPTSTGDVSGDHIEDVFVVSTSGIVNVLGGAGHFLWRSEPDLNLGGIFDRPVLVDQNEDETPDLIVPSTKKGLVALDGLDGSEIWNSAEWVDGEIKTAPLAIDIDQDGHLDFITVTDNGRVMAITVKQGKISKLWEKDFGNAVTVAPVKIVAENIQMVVFTVEQEGLVALNATNGESVWTSNIQKPIQASPVSANFDSDGIRDIAVVSADGMLDVIDGMNGEVSWSIEIAENTISTPGLFDLNDDQIPELVILDMASNLRIFDVVQKRQILIENVKGAQGFRASPVLGDVNSDGYLDVVLACESGRVVAYSINKVVPLGEAF